MPDFHLLVQGLTHAIGAFDNKELAFGIAIAIVVFALIIGLYLHFRRHRPFLLPIQKLTRELIQARETQDQPQNRLAVADEVFQGAPKAHRLLWQDYRGNLHENSKDSKTYVNLINPKVWFSLNAFPGRGYEQWCNTWAGVFLTIGLLFTFIGLSAALLKVGHIDGADSAAMKAAITGILGVSSAKFITSIAGLIAYIGFSLVTRWYQSGQQQAVADLADAIQYLSIPLTPELLLYEQKEVAQKQLDRLDRFTDDLAVAIDDKLKSHFDVLKESTDKLPEAISRPIVESMSSLDRIGTSIAQSNAESLNDVLSAAKLLVRALGKVKDDMGGVGDSLGSHFADFSKRMDEITSALGQTPQQINAALENTLNRLTDAIDSLVERMKQSSQIAGESFGNQVANAGKVFDQTLGAQLASFEGTLNHIMSTLGETPGQISAAMDKTLDRLTLAINMLVAKLEQSGQAAGTNFENRIDQAGKSFDQTLGAQLASFDKTLNHIISTLGETPGQINAAMDKTLDRLTSAINMLVDLLKQSGEAAAANFGKQIGDAGKSFGDQLANSSSKLAGAVSQLQNTTQGFSNQLQSVEKSLTHLPGAMEKQVGKLEQAGDTFNKAGQNQLAWPQIH